MHFKRPGVYGVRIFAGLFARPGVFIKTRPFTERKRTLRAILPRPSVKDLAGTDSAAQRTLMRELFTDLLADYRVNNKGVKWAERKIRLHLDYCVR